MWSSHVKAKAKVTLTLDTEDTDPTVWECKKLQGNYKGNTGKYREIHIPVPNIIPNRAIGSDGGWIALHNCTEPLGVGSITDKKAL